MNRFQCHFCKEEGFSLDEGVEFFAGFACDYCRTECPACGDWLGNEPETIVDGQRWHKVCADENENQMDLPLEAA